MDKTETDAYTAEVMREGMTDAAKRLLEAIESWPTPDVVNAAEVIALIHRAIKQVEKVK